MNNISANEICTQRDSSQDGSTSGTIGGGADLWWGCGGLLAARLFVYYEQGTSVRFPDAKAGAKNPSQIYWRDGQPD